MNKLSKTEKGRRTKRRTRARTHRKVIFWFIVVPSLVFAGLYFTLKPKKPIGVLTPVEAYAEPNIRGLEVVSSTKLKFYTDEGMSREAFLPLLKCFLAAVTIPSSDLKVNLDPDDPDNVAPDNLAHTYLGRLMLEQDLLLKQAGASCYHPKTASGKLFFMFHDKPPELERKCIVPDKAVIVDSNNSMLIAKASLSIRSDMENNVTANESRKFILPAILEYVNKDRRFAPLRQAYGAVILATWFKNKLSHTTYRAYINYNKLVGIEAEDKRQEIWLRYKDMWDKKVWRWGTRYFGGVEFDKPRYWINTSYAESLDFEGLKAFEVELSVLHKEPTIYQDTFKPHEVGGIDLEAIISVVPGRVKDIEWGIFGGLGYEVGEVESEKNNTNIQKRNYRR